MWNSILAIDLQAAFSSIETWIAAGVALLASSTLGGVIIGLLMKKFTKKVNNQTVVSEQKVSDAAKKAAKETVKAVVGKSFNVNIKSEVDKAIKAEIEPIKLNTEKAATSARNAEIAAAHVLLAQSRSRLLDKKEQENLQSIAKKILANVNGDVATPAVIEFTEEKKESVSTEKEVDEKTEDNAALVSFADVD